MEYFVISVAAFLTAILTFFSGFGLGTILTPIFIFFFPVEIAIALTGVVHFLNNIFKLILIGRHAQKPVLVRFGIPAVIAAFIGAWLLISLTGLNPVGEYELLGRTLSVSPVNLTIAILLFLFAAIELLPSFKDLSFGMEKLPIGGALSGFFGGLSGHQGALRSAFLIKVGLSKEAFIATGVVIACFIDFTRLSVYFSRFAASGLEENIGLIITATGSAMAGALIGKRLLKKITLTLLHKIVAVMLIIISIALGMGII